jgi:serine protease Do
MVMNLNDDSKKTFNGEDIELLGLEDIYNPLEGNEEEIYECEPKDDESCEITEELNVESDILHNEDNNISDEERINAICTKKIEQFYFEKEKLQRQENNKKKTSKAAKVIIAVALCGIVAGGAFQVGIQYGEKLGYENNIPNYYGSDSENSAKYANYDEDQNSVVEIVKLAGSGVVGITSKVAYRDFFDNIQMSSGQGSGVIFKVNSEGVYILTNQHVIDGAKELIVEILPDKVFPAIVVGSDTSTDLAVIKIKKDEIDDNVYKNIKPLVFGDSDALKVGEKAIAIGNPLGYNDTVTVGYISALGREIKSKNSLKLIQTDAAINPGNSGGALVNDKGEVIGINTIKIAEEGVEGLGFSIPINSAKPIVDELIKNGYVSRPFMGISGSNISEEAADVYEVPIGIVVRDVYDNSGAYKAGMQRGDIIVSVDGEIMTDMEDLKEIINSKSVGDELKVELVRDGKEKIEVNVILEDMNATN